MSVSTMIVLDDDEDMGSIVADVAELAGFHATLVTNASSFFDKIKTSMPDVLVIDMVMPDQTGIEIIESLAKRGCRSGIFLISGYDGLYVESANSIATAMGLKVLGTITKPIGIDHLEELFGSILQKIDTNILDTTP